LSIESQEEEEEKKQWCNNNEVSRIVLPTDLLLPLTLKLSLNKKNNFLCWFSALCQD